MSYLFFGTLPSSVPPVFDTTPCLKQMHDYEDCAFESNTKQMEIIHPSWPSMWPRMLTDGKSIDFGHTPMHQDSSTHYTYMRPLTKKIKHYLWECEEERFVYKACLRKLISLKRTDRHTSWDTASVSNLSLV
ncbi:unnamed protein product [Paramecium primaurelia]|uniref:Uncharacterized protein n=2 Tax=Paramecium TaxID=5884 RepID=A0A8S1P1N6_PARPR|nr:unnamed protein product [Paramecium primaurelia]CAD8112621.1 unnamed protein product [Paramecium primaurelia]CAD8155609.1 unnamed protein product [Paramecium pentaurelia]CAD8207689.1 unnamed protein product [Paramecium pentaurelia]